MDKREYFCESINSKELLSFFGYSLCFFFLCKIYLLVYIHVSEFHTLALKMMHRQAFSIHSIYSRIKKGTCYIYNQYNNSDLI